MLKFPAILLVTSALLSMSWQPRRGRFGEDYGISSRGLPRQIAFYPHHPGPVPKAADGSAFAVRDEQELRTAMKEICEAADPQPWKGATWDEIRIEYTDTVFILYTNQKVIGGPWASGSFYRLPKTNFITEKLRAIRRHGKS